MRPAVIALVVIAGCAAETTDQRVDYHTQIAPLIAKHCRGCHVTGGIAPFALDTYAEVKKVALAIKRSVKTRTMPPWPVDNGGDCNTYRDARWLSDESVAKIATWIDDGLLEGTAGPASRPKATTPPSLRVDASLTIATAYAPDRRLKDDYRCFILDPKLTKDRFLTGYRVVPGNARVVHHVILFALDSAAADDGAKKLDDADSTPGYGCFGAAGVTARPIAGWAPGTPAVRYPTDSGLRLQAGRKLVMQVHYNLEQGAQPDRTRVELELATTIVKEAFVIPLAHTQMNVAAGQANATTTFTLALGNLAPVGAFVHGIYPHMHTLGRTLRVEADNGGPKRCLVDVPRWDFGWQQFYFYEKPIYVGSSDKLRITCSYDTRRRTAPVKWGEGTADEMCLNAFYVTLF